MTFRFLARTLGVLSILVLAVACSEEDPKPTVLCESPCACDTTTACDGEGCACDPECGGCLPSCESPCGCDMTTACDPECPCDPECDLCLPEQSGPDAGVPDGGEPPEGEAPFIRMFRGNVWNIVEGSSVEFTLEAFDFDGADDIVEAYIETRDGGARITDFTRVSSEGQTAIFSGSVSWDQIYAAEPFTLIDGSLDIGLTAIVVDAAGHRASDSTSVGASCNFGDWGQICGGRCVSLYGDSNHCGGCGIRCGAGDNCRMASCGSPTGWSMCFAETEATSCADYCQGRGLSCGNSCGVLSGTREIDNLAGQGYFDENCRTLPHTNYDPQIPDFKQTEAACTTSFSAWPQASELTHFKCCCR